jgi:hypothetical protein
MNKNQQSWTVKPPLFHIYLQAVKLSERLRAKGEILQNFAEEKTMFFLLRFYTWMAVKWSRNPFFTNKNLK